MPKVKAPAICIIRTMIQEKGEDIERAFCARLSPTVRLVFESVVPTRWIDIREDEEILQSAAAILFPQDPQGLEHLGEAVARVEFTGIFRIFLRMATLPFVVSQASRIWKAINDKGSVQVRILNKNSGHFEIQGYPELSRVHRDYTNGLLKAILNLTRARNVRIQRDDRNPQAWAWNLEWE